VILQMRLRPGVGPVCWVDMMMVSDDEMSDCANDDDGDDSRCIVGCLS